MTVYVLHSPYPDGSWRGWNKCYGRDDGVCVYQAYGEAEAVRQAMPSDLGIYWTVWPIEIEEPPVRSARQMIWDTR